MTRTIGCLTLLLLIISMALPAEEAAPPGKVKVNFSSMDLVTLAQQVERLTQRTFLYQEEQLRTKKVTLQSEKAISPEELYRVFQSACLMNGFILVPVEGAELNLVKIVQTREAVKEPGNQPVLLKGQPLPEGDTMVTYILSPKHIAPSKAVTVLTSALSTAGASQQIAGTDLIIINDVASAVRRAEKILALVDQPGPPVINISVELKHLSAPKAQSQISEFTQAIERASGMGEITSRTRLAIIADERLNTLHLIGGVADIQLAQDFIVRIDREAPVARRSIAYYKMKNVAVADVADTVRQLLGLAVATREAERSEQAKAAAAAVSPLVGAPRTDLAGAPAFPAGVTPPSTTFSAPKPAEPATASSVRKPSAKAVAPGTAEASGPEIDVIPLPSQNTLVVIGDKTVHDEVKGILDNLDKRKGQVLMEVAIVQVTGDDSLETGIEALYQNDAGWNVGTGFGLGTMADPGGVGFPTQQNLDTFTGTAARYLKQGDLSVLLRLVASKSNVNIASQPLLLVNDNEEANFTTKVSQPTIATSQGTTSNITSFAGFAEATTTLKIRPTISPDGYLNLKITQEVEEFTGSSATAGIPPPKTSNQVNTMITVPDRQTIVMGGFIRDTSTQTRQGIPLLMDIPVVKYAVSHETTSTTKQRLYLFVRPRILTMDGFADLKSASRDRLEDIKNRTAGSPIEPEIKEALLPIGESPAKE
jgi:general secretion pathway protein D